MNDGLNNNFNMNNNENNSQEMRTCNVCGNVLNSEGICESCKSSEIVNEKPKKEKKPVPTSAVVLLAIFIANLIFALPTAVYFIIFWAVLGSIFIGFSENSVESWSTVLIPVFLGLGYLGASIFGLIAFIINVVKAGKFLKKAILITFIGFIAGILFPFIVAFIFAITPEPNPVVEIEKGAIIYQDENYIIRQQELKKTYSKITLTIDIENLNSETKELSFNDVSVNNIYLDSGYDYKTYKSGEKEIVVNLYSSDIKIEKIDSYYIFFQYGDNKNLVAKLVLDGEKVNVKKNLNEKGYKVALENEYFRVYYKPNTKSNIVLFIEGKSKEKNTINISRIDADVKLGYETMNYKFPLYENTTKEFDIDYNPCKYNMRYLKIYYSIYDEDNNVIVEDGVEETTFGKPQFDKKYCKAK